MATAAQIASAGTYITDDVGVEVTDGNVSRVQLGKLASGSYGLRVVSSDGSTVIIDGTSDMFKIQASGTGSQTVASPNVNVSSVTTLSGLGTFPSSIPALASYSNDGNTTDANHFLASSTLNEAVFVAATSGGAVTTQVLAQTVTHSLSSRINSSSSFLEIWSWMSATSVGGGLMYYKYYVLIETAF